MGLSLNLGHYSYKALRLASILLALASPFAENADAKSDFNVENVIVDAAGTDTTDARSHALEQGQAEAFKELISRRDPAKASELAGRLTQKQIAVAVRGFEVTDEKMSADHYHAIINYTFDPAQIQTLDPVTPPAAAVGPAVAGAPPAIPLRTSKAVLILPVYNEGGSAKLWQDDNKWRNLWFDAALESGGGLIVAPQGDLEDRIDVDDTNVEAGKRCDAFAHV